MAFLPNYTNDIFVSYGHRPAEETLTDEGRGWTQIVVKHLEAFINDRLGLKRPSPGIKIWVDPELKGNEPLTGQLKSRVQQSALLLVFMSDYYLKSTWCGDEAEWFLEAVKDKPQHKSRVFIVRTGPSDESKWHKAFLDERDVPLKGYKFYQEPGYGQTPEPLGWPIPDLKDKSYTKALSSLADQLCRELEDIKKLSIISIIDKSEPKHKSFLAYTTEDLDHKREEIKRRLEEKGFSVLPEGDFNGVSQLDEVLKTQLRECTSFVQILSSTPGRLGYVKRQYEAARDAKLQIFQWWHPQLSLKSIWDTNYRAFMEAMSKVEAPDLDAFVEYVLKETDRHKPETDRIRLKKPGLFVNAEKSDYDFVDDTICPGLSKHFRCFSPMRGGTPSERDRDWHYHLSRRDGVIIVRVKVDISWVYNEIDRVEDEIMLERKGRNISIAIVEGPPEKKIPPTVYEEIPKFFCPQRDDFPEDLHQWLLSLHKRITEGSSSDR